VGTPGQAVFKVVEAPAGELNVDTLGATATATVQVSYPTLTVGDTVGLRLSGVVLRDTPIRKVSTVGVLTFDVPNAWLVENLNHTVTLTHTHKEGGTGSLITSAPILIKVVGVLSDGQRVANRLNEQYATTSNTCPGNKAAFYCSGVLIRVTDASTAFHAWNPSPSSVALGSVAFSYMKVDLSMNRLAFGKLQGLILKPAEVFTQNGDYPLKVLCAYAYDANSVSRSLNGCGENIDFPTDSGTCASLKITTLAAWRAHFQKYPITSYLRFHHQCSLGTDQASFELSLTAREDPAAELVAYAHNEIIIKTWPQDTKNLPIEAFFYWYTGTETSGLAAAKYMQQDFYQMTAKKVPIIRVIPDTSAAQIFSYHAAEQGL
ncbi:hypothetical protein QN396_25400, partial [Pseudomonas sp. DC1.2]|nr:hypothetical protein [Pseudomonas sp. DC1.2]